MAETLEKRVEDLEQKVGQLLANPLFANELGIQDWRQAIGLFPNNKLMKAIDSSGKAIRDKESKKARRQKAAHRRKSK